MSKLTVIRVEPAYWKKMSENAHIISFGEKRPSSKDRIDYALLVVDQEVDLPVGYITVRETDDDTVYWQHGGGFPGSVGVPIFRSYEACLNWTGERYKRVYTLINNQNQRMLKMAMKVGFEIVGIKNFQNNVMLEHLVEFKKGE